MMRPMPTAFYIECHSAKCVSVSRRQCWRTLCHRRRSYHDRHRVLEEIEGQNCLHRALELAGDVVRQR